MYDFRTLSPVDFEELVRDLVQAEFKIRCESFGPGKDLGIDLRFAAAQGSGIIQAKHYVGSGADALLGAVRKENDKIVRLRPRRYILATSVSLTPALKTRLLQALSAVQLVPEDILGQADLNNLLGRHPEIEKKHFKLWLASTTVLERLLHSGVYNRTDAEMDVIKAMVPKFVHNESVPKAEALIAKHGALIISGEPGVGKSTLGRMLIWLHAAQDWRVFVVDDMKEAFEVASTTEKRLIFFDDFLGQVRLSDDLIRGMDQRFPPFLARVRSNNNLRFVLTTRDYILRQAQAQSSRLDSTEVNASEFVLNVGHYTRGARARMLYNHIYFSNLSVQERDALLEDDFFLKMIDHRNFSPRLIDLFTSADYVAVAGVPIRQAVGAVLENPQELWEKPYRAHISNEGRALMLSLFFNNARTPIASLERSFARIVKAMELPLTLPDMPIRFRLALKELEGSVIAIQDRHVSFSNPGVRDYLGRAIKVDRFLDAATGVLTEYAEVERAWSTFIAESPKADKFHPLANAWRGVVKRLTHRGGGSPLQRMELGMNIYNYLQIEDAVDLVSAALQEMEVSGIDSSEASSGRLILENLILTILPSDVVDAARTVVSNEFGRMISEQAWAMTLDDLRASASSLKEFGSDLDVAAGLIRVGIDLYIEQMKDELDELRREDEIETYEAEINQMMVEHDVSHAPKLRAEKAIQSRREELQERDETDSDRDYIPSKPAKTIETSDADIRSMFESLKSR